MEDSQLPHGMTKINSRLFKIVIREGVGDTLSNLSHHQIEYKYDYFRAIADVSNREEPLPGHMMALATMKDQEEAEFWMSRELLSLAKKSDVFVRMKIVSVQPAKHQNDDKFHKQFEEAVTNYATARDHFKAENFHAAIEIYRKWTEIMENIQPANESQDLKQKTCLKKMYQNWSICCIKLCDPHQCREAVTKYKRIAPIEQNPKVLYAKGKALIMFNKFPESRKCLKAAERLAPNDEVIKKALDEGKQKEKEKIQAEANAIGERFVKLNLRPTSVPLAEINQYKNQTSVVITKPEPLKATISARSISLPSGFEKSPINVILELCTAKRFPPPIFLLCGIGPPHNPLFFYTCSLLKHQVKGFGPSKKLAKRNAAINMLEAINRKM